MEPSPFPKISIITCTYNSEKHLRKALDSVEEQEYGNIEHIINDSYSTDGTLAIIQDYITRNAARYPIHFVQSEAKGVANALNTATAVASGELIHYLHSDDYYLDAHALQRAAQPFHNNPGLIWMTGNFLVEFRGKRYTVPQTLLLRKDAERALSTMNLISHENTLMRREAVLKYGGFNETKGYVVEYSLWLKLIKEHRPMVVNDQFTVFIIHKGSTSTGSLWRFLKAVLRAYRTQRKEKVIPFMGYYPDTRAYKIWMSVRKQLGSWSLISSGSG